MDNARLQLLLDRAEISDVQLRYATGVDMRENPEVQRLHEGSCPLRRRQLGGWT